MTLLSPQGISSVLTSITLVSLLIGVFYFTYVPIVERSVVKREVREIINSLAKDIHDIIPKRNLDVVRPIVQNQLKPVNLSFEDNRAAQQNQAVTMRAMKYLGGFAAVNASIVTLIYLNNRQSVDFSKIAYENAVLLLAVAVTYFVFVTFIGRNYRAADPNFVKRQIIDSFREFGHRGERFAPLQ